MRFFVALIGCLLLAFSIHAQTVEVCNDGIDNDGNGQVDCADSFCSYAANIERGCNCFDNVDNDGDGAIDKADPNCASYYGLEFVGEGSNCSITPPGTSTPFAFVGPPVKSGQNTADTQSKVTVGDIDGNGVPDVVITSKWNSQLRVVASDGTILADFKTTGQGAKIFSGTGGCNPKNLLYEHENLIADIDKDGKAEIFGIVSNRQGNPSSPPTCFFLVGFRYTPGTLTPLFDAVQIGTDRPGIPGIADFDGDGKAEIYLRDRIYAAETGKLLATGAGNWDLDVSSGSVAVNILGDSKMELVVGTKIYGIPLLTNRNPAVPAPLTLLQDMNTISANKCFVKLANDPIEYGIDTHSTTSVADVDGDGFLDVVISGALNSNVGKTAVFYWNVNKGTVSHFLPPDPVFANGWPWGTGRVNLGDANGDSKLDLSFVAGSQLFCLTTDAAGTALVPLWATPRTINDSRSGVVAVTIYDFDNDGEPEMVYRDSQELVIIDGATGQNKIWSAVCQSHTYTEGPIIADVNGDGATDICVTCAAAKFDVNDPIQQQALGEVRLFFSNANNWLPTRKVWNQPGYFVVNIKDDLTLPSPQLDQGLIFGTGPCPNGLPGPQRPLNQFMNQVPFLSSEGCPVFPAPDLTYIGDDPANPGVDIDGDGVYNPAVVVTPPICGNLDISAFFNIVNSGDLPITDNVPVGFFNGDPLNGGTYLHNTVLNINNLQVGQTLQTPPTTFNGPGTVFTLYIVLYSDGSLPLVIDNTKECSIANNTYTVLIAPDPFTVTIEKLSDNFKCDNTAPDNGELRAHIFKGATEVFDYSPFSFQWYDGAGIGSPIAGPAGTDYILSDRAEGDYTIVVTNTAKGCASDPVSETILRLGNDPEITINVLSDQTQCSPANGRLEAVITGGNTGFTFEWFDISLNPLGIVGPIANNLTAGNYLVRVSKDGCTKISNPATVNGPQIPDAQAQVLQNVVDCSNPNSGSIQADALFNAVIQDPALYQFDWYFYDNATSTRGSILPPAYGSGQTRTGLPAGFYQAEVKQISTQCVSALAPIVEVQTLTVIPTAVITEVAPQTSCDTNNPNGILTADALVGGVPQDPTDFTFEWFEGDNTLPANAHTTVSGVNGKQADQIKGGGIYYTVRITTGNNCAVTEKLIITENINVPIITLTPSPNSICDPAKASSTFNGSVTASVTFDGAPVAPGDPNYTYSWHDGSLPTDPAPVPNSTNEVLSQQDAGDYTLVVTRTDLFCTSLPATEQIVNAVVLPALTTSTISSTNCTPGLEDGVAEVLTVDGGPVPGANYTYAWTGPVAPAFPVDNPTNNANTPQLINLQGGAGYDYTVLVTNTNTGCENTATLNVADGKVIPVITLAASDNTICAPATAFNGIVTATITNQGANPITDYSFVFGAGMGAGTQLLSPNHNQYTQLNGGPTAYTVDATQISTGCVSSQVNIPVANNQDLPDLVTGNTPSTNCLPLGLGLENGIAQVVDVDAGQPLNNYTYAWTGPGSFPVTPAGNNSDTETLINVQGGIGYDYSVLVTNKANGCFRTASVNVGDAKVLPVITLAASDNTICAPATSFNGIVTATITNQGANPITDYSFVFADGMGPGIQLASPNHNQYTNLNGGPTAYTSIATQTTTGCVSSQGSIPVANNQDLPDLVTGNTPSTNCLPLGLGLENGIAQVVDVDAGQPLNNYTYAWTGPGSFPVTPAGNNSDTETLINVQGGIGYDYSVLVTNKANGCFRTASVNVGDAKVLPVITLAASDNTICAPATSFNGIVTATITNQGANPITDYSFVFADGMGPGIQLASPNHNQYTNLNGGPTAYTSIATQTTTGCVSSQGSIPVANNQDLPDLVTGNTPSTNCLPLGLGLENGIAQVVDVDAGQPLNNYTYAWTGPGSFPVTPAGNNSDTETLINVQGGIGYDYSVLVTNKANGCFRTASVNVGDAKVLPVITLAASDNTICAPATSFNGIVTATITNQGANPITDYSFVFADGMGPGIQLASPNHNQYTNLNGGPTAYTSIATQTTTGCVSSQGSIPVANNQDLPDLVTGNTPSTNCLPLGLGLENGIAQVVDVDAGQPLNNYTYLWTGPAAPAFPVTPAGNNSDTETLINVQGGIGYDYSVLVTNKANGCFRTASVNVGDAKVLPVITLAASDNTICAPATSFNGIVTATITNQGANPITDYSFVFADGMGPGIQLASPNHNQYTNLNGGPTAYTSIATQTTTGCVSSQGSIPVANNQDLPDLVTGNTPSTNCLPLGLGLENGIAQVVDVDAGQPLNNYTYLWTGSAAPAFPVTPAGNNSDTETLINVQGGIGYDYSVLVTNKVNGCFRTASVNVGDAQELPILTLTPVPNTICDPAIAIGGAFDGQVSAVVDAVGNYVGNVPGDFTFNWNTGLSGVGQNLLANRDVGTYSVTAQHTNTGCTSGSFSAQVTSAKTLPSITTGQTPSTNCAGGVPDGVAQVLNVLPNGNTYDYNWYDGNSASGGVDFADLGSALTTSNYTGVQGGVIGASLIPYTVEVTILQTGCINTATVGVSDDSQVPILGPLTPTDNTLCTVVKNGSATVSMLNYRGPLVPPASYGDFTFNWSGGTQGPPETTTALAAGNYTLTVQHIASQCTSNPVAVTIADNLFFPVIDVAEVDQTSCDPGTPNGSLTATIDEAAIGGGAGVTAGYTFTWVDDVTSGSTISNFIGSLKGDQTYSITAVRDVTQCTSTQVIYLNETLTTPTIGVVVTPLTICQAPNGELTASVLPAGPLYEFFWYNGNDAVDEAAVIAGASFSGLGAAGDTYAGLIPGDYTVVVRDDATRCQSLQVIETVPDASAPINPVAANTIIPVDCNFAGGTLDGGVQFINSDFSALAATDELTTVIPLGLVVDDQIIIKRSGALTLPAGIEENKRYFIESIAGNVLKLKLAAGPGLPIDLTTDGNGNIGDFSTAGYSYEWYADTPSPTNPGLGSINYFTNPPVYTGPALTGTSTLAGIATGLYTIEVTDLATNCKTYLPHTLPFLGSHAVVKINKTNSQICNPGYVTGDGSIEIQIENPPAAPPGTDQTDYEVTLYQGVAVIVPTFVPVPPVNPFTVSNTLPPNSYVVEVVEKYSGFDCLISQDVIIGADALPPVLALSGAITPNTYCPPSPMGDGRIDILVDKDPDDLTVGTTYDIDVNPDPNAAFPILGQAPPGPFAATGLGPASYTFTATASTGCSTSKTFTVINNPVVSQIVAGNVSVTNAEFCDVALEQSARVVINQLNIIGGGPENLDDYRFDWYTDASLMTNILSAVGDNTATKGGEELSNTGAPLPAPPVTNGAYWVTATKLTDVSATGGVGCKSASFSINIATNKINPQITLAPFSDTSCDPTFFEGGIQVDVATASGPGVGGTYDYTWAPNGGVGEPANSVGNSGVANLQNNINDGTYTLIAQNVLTGCASTLATTIQRATPPVFTLQATATNLTNCTSFNGLINNLQVFINGAPGVVPDFDYVWYKADLLPGSVVLDGQGPPPLDTELTFATYPGISLDKYFVKAIRKAGGAGVGCESAALRKDVFDDRAYPQVASSSLPNSACLDPNWDGQITVSAGTTGFGAGTVYDFIWTDDPGPAVANIVVSNGNVASVGPVPPSTLSLATYTTPGTDQIGPGGYIVRVTNQTNTCFTDASVTVQQNTIPIEVASVGSSPLTHCTVDDGSVSVTGITVGGGAAAFGEFAYSWTGPGGPYLVQNTGNILTFGDYIVTVTKNSVATSRTSFGCTSAPATATVLDQRTNPSVSMSSLPNSACLDPNWDGQITVSAGTTGFGAGTVYDFIWTDDPGPAVANIVVSNGNVASVGPVPPSTLSLATYTTPGTDQIGPGGYIVRVTNQTNTCFTDASVTVQQNTVPIEVASLSSSPLTHCTVADGSVNVTGITVGGAGAVFGEFGYNWTGTGGPYATQSVNGLTFGNYVVTVTKTSAATNRTAFGCVSAPATATVLDQRTNPSVSMSSLPNSACLDPNWDGQITVSAGTTGFGAGTVYDFIWTDDPGPAVANIVVSNGNVASVGPVPPSTLSLATYTTPGTDQIGPGGYIVRVTNQTNTCFTDASVTVQQNTVPIEVASLSSSPLTHCTVPDGSVNVTGITVGGAGAVFGEFGYNWTGAGGPYATQAVNGLTFGNYVVQVTKNSAATNRTSFGCTSAPATASVLDERFTPSVSLSQVANTACNGNFDGQITINATTAGVGAGANYGISWLAFAPGSSAANPGAVLTPYSTSAPDIIGPGSYTVQVTNATTFCFSTASIVLQNNPQPLDVVTVSITDQLICYPDGSISVSTLSSGGPGNYTYEWFKNAPTGPALVDNFATPINVASLVAGTAAQEFPTMGFGTYFVKATKNAGAAPGSGCVTPPFRVDIQDLHMDPRVQMTYQPNSSCDPINPNGVVLANAAEQGGFNGDTYSFAWTFNGGALPGTTTITPTNNSNQLTDAGDGTYTLVIQNTSATGCSFTSSLMVQKDLNVSLPNIIDAITVDPLDCLSSGSATVTRVGIGGTTFYNDPPDDLDLNFNYKWYQNTFTPADQIVGEVNHDLLNRLPGTYYVTVLDGTTLCESGPKEVLINDDQIIYPDVNITQTARQISCDAITGTAALAATADGQTDADLDYNFNWFTTLDATGPSFATTSTITGQQKGNYSVEVLRTSTGCSAQALFIVPDEAPQFTPVISLGGQGRTLCVGQDGLILARVIDISPQYPFAFDFTSDLYFGATPNLGNPPDVPNMAQVPGFAENFVESGLAEGFYTVRITDNNTGCIAVATQEVLDQRMNPVVAIVEENPLTNCDPTIANGQLSATADGGLIGGFNFSWYAGTAVATPPSAVLSTINKLIASGVGNYVVRATNKITGCFADLAGTITDATILPPIPQAETLRDRTNCLTPNGLVTASVGGITFGYSFSWYDGATVSGGPDFNGVNYFDLDIGDYSVTATDIITGCVSNPAITPVADARRIPEFVIETTPSFCIDSGRPNGNGSVILTLTNEDGDNVVLDDVAWTDAATNQPVGNGTALYELFPGFYQADAITFEGCTNTGTAEVKTEIAPFNGVSNNSDGSNDAFIVDCISLFPNNNVKIFNRNGIKVYEMDGYNNADIAFTGLGINGLYLQGKELPVGTYYYIIDKRDGSKPVAGYLELDR